MRIKDGNRFGIGVVQSTTPIPKHFIPLSRISSMPFYPVNPVNPVKTSHIFG